MKSLSILLCSLATGLVIGLSMVSPALAREDGFSLYRAGKYAEAARAFAKADMDRPDEIRFRYNRGVAALKAGEAEAGTAALESALVRSKDSEVRYRSAYNLGNAAFEKKDYRKAADYYKKALVEKPKDPDARANFQLALWNAARAEKEKDGKKSESGKDKKDSEGKEGGKKDEKQKGGKDGKKDQAGQEKQESGKDSQQERKESVGDGKQQGGQGKDKGRDEKGPEPSPVSPNDLKGELSAQGAQRDSGRQDKGGPDKAPSMERLKAEAMVENVTEDSSLLFQGLPGKRGRAGSGKNW